MEGAAEASVAATGKPRLPYIVVLGFQDCEEPVKCGGLFEVWP